MDDPTKDPLSGSTVEVSLTHLEIHVLHAMLKLVSNLPPGLLMAAEPGLFVSLAIATEVDNHLSSMQDRINAAHTVAEAIDTKSWNELVSGRAKEILANVLPDDDGEGFDHDVDDPPTTDPRRN